MAENAKKDAAVVNHWKSMDPIPRRMHDDRLSSRPCGDSFRFPHHQILGTRVSVYAHQPSEIDHAEQDSLFVDHVDVVAQMR